MSSFLGSVWQVVKPAVAPIKEVALQSAVLLLTKALTRKRKRKGKTESIRD